jgi:hypothetical protein
MKLWKMKKSCDSDHEIMNLVEINVGTPAIVGRALIQILLLFDQIDVWYPVCVNAFNGIIDSIIE